MCTSNGAPTSGRAMRRPAHAALLLCAALCVLRSCAGGGRDPDAARANAILRRLSSPLLAASGDELQPPLERDVRLRPAVRSALLQLRSFQSVVESPPRSRAPLTQPCELVSSHGALTVNLSFGLGYIGTPAGSLLLRCWKLNGVCQARSTALVHVFQVPAPTLRLRPGDVLTLHVHNELAASRPRCVRAQLAAPPVGEQADGQCENTFHDPNALNIHTHGLHVSPRADDVFVRHAPGERRTYSIPIRPDHAPGTFWWHPHHHGGGCLHVASGAAGALIVDAPPSSSEDAFADELVLVLQEWRLNGLVSVLSLLNASYADEYASVLDAAASACGFDPATHDPSSWHAQLNPSCSFTVVNGALRPTLRLRAGAWSRLRLVAATWSSSLALGVRGCEASLLAIDGVPLSPRPVPLRDAALFGPGAGLVLAPGQRADVAVRCAPGEEPALLAMPRPASGDAFLGAWFQQFLPNDVNTEALVLADILVQPPLQLPGGAVAVTLGGGASDQPPPLPLPSPPPAYLSSLLSAAAVAERHEWAFDAALFCLRQNGSNCDTLNGGGSVHAGGHPPRLLERAAMRLSMAQQPSRYVTGVTSSGLDDVSSIFYINGAVYRGAGAPALLARVGEVHEWTLRAGWVSAHVVHLHATPFQVVSYELADRSAPPGAAYLRGRWMDSVLVPAGGRVVVRLRFADVGPTLLHCHTLLHHDVGMAAVVDVQPPVK